MNMFDLSYFLHLILSPSDIPTPIIKNSILYVSLELPDNDYLCFLHKEDMSFLEKKISFSMNNFNKITDLISDVFLIDVCIAEKILEKFLDIFFIKTIFIRKKNQTQKEIFTLCFSKQKNLLYKDFQKLLISQFKKNPKNLDLSNSKIIQLFLACMLNCLQSEHILSSHHQIDLTKESIWSTYKTYLIKNKSFAVTQHQRFPKTLTLKFKYTHYSIKEIKDFFENKYRETITSTYSINTEHSVLNIFYQFLKNSSPLTPDQTKEFLHTMFMYFLNKHGIGQKNT